MRLAPVQREIADFSAMHNDLVTRRDEEISRAKDSLDGVHVRAGQRVDPFVEQDIGVLKGKLENMLEALERARIVAGHYPC